MLSVEPSVPANVSVFDTVSVLASTIVIVDPVAGGVNEILFNVVALATPSVGVVNDGLY